MRDKKIAPKIRIAVMFTGALKAFKICLPVDGEYYRL
jgi:hypothetical protein